MTPAIAGTHCELKTYDTDSGIRCRRNSDRVIRYVRLVAEAAWWLLQVGLLLLIEIVSVGFANPRYPSAPRLDRNLRGHVPKPERIGH